MKTKFNSYDELPLSVIFVTIDISYIIVLSFNQMSATDVTIYNDFYEP